MIILASSYVFLVHHFCKVHLFYGVGFASQGLRVMSFTGSAIKGLGCIRDLGVSKVW